MMSTCQAFVSLGGGFDERQALQLRSRCSRKEHNIFRWLICLVGCEGREVMNSKVLIACFGVECRDSG
jgi:hypothetical protein